MPEFIFKINEAVVDDATGEAVMKPEYVQRLVRCASCNSCKIEFAIEDSSPFLNVVKMLYAFPSAEQQRKRGKWRFENYIWICSECGMNPTRGMGYVQGRGELFAYCPNCGAEMRGGEIDGCTE